jgi:uncharacterized protein YnzC (UPF0291/DUF896 family)
MSVIRNLTVRVGADLGDFQRKMDRAAKDMAKMGKAMQSAGSVFTKAITLPAIGAATAIGALVVKTTDYASKIFDASVKTGISIQSLQELEYIAGQTGVSFDSIQGAVGKFTAGLRGALGGTGDMAKAFEVLGVTTKDSSGNLRTVSDLMFESISKLRMVDDETMKATMASAIFGKGFMELMPLMEEAAGDTDELRKRFKELGLALSDEEIKKFEAFGDNLEEMKKKFSKAGMEIASKFLPLFEKIAAEADTKLIPFLNRMVEVIDKLVTGFLNLSPQMQKFLVIAAGGAVALGPVLSGLGGILTTGSDIIRSGILGKIGGLLKGIGTTAPGLAGAASSIGLIGIAAIGAAWAVSDLYSKYTKRVDDMKSRNAQGQKQVDPSIAAGSSTIDRITSGAGPAALDLAGVQNLKPAAVDAAESGADAIDEAMKKYEAAMTEAQEKYMKLFGGGGGDGGATYTPGAKQDALRQLYDADKISLQKYYDELIKLEGQLFKGYRAKSTDQLMKELTGSDENLATKAQGFLSLTKEQAAIREQLKGTLTEIGAPQKQDALRGLLDSNRITLQQYYDGLIKLENDMFKSYKSKKPEELYKDLISPDEATRAKSQGFLSLAQEIAAAFAQLGEKSKESLDKFKESVKSLVGSMRSAAEGFANFTGLFDIFERKPISGERLLNRLKSQVKAMLEWRTSLATLEKRGINENLLQDLRSMGPAAVDSITALSKMTDAQLAEYSSLYKSKNVTGAEEAEKMVGRERYIENFVETQTNLYLNNTKISTDDEVIDAIVKKLRLAGVKV